MEFEFLPTFCYQTKYFYIITLPKIASSWLFDLTHTYPQIMDIDSDDEFWASLLVFDQKNLNISRDGEVSSFKFDYLKNDWDKLISGNNDVSRNFIFLLRNPVNKFVSGTMQDVLYENKDNPDTDPLNMTQSDFLNHFVDYPNKEELEKLKILNEQVLNDGSIVKNIHWWTQDGNWWNNDFMVNTIRWWIKKKLDAFFKLGFNMRDYKSDHKASNIYLYYKILFNSKIDKNKIKILDIDKENLYDYLVKEYGIDTIVSDVSYKQERNKTGRTFKNLIIECMKGYSNLIDVVLYQDILMYIDIYKEVYDINLSYDDVFKQLK